MLMHRPSARSAFAAVVILMAATAPASLMAAGAFDKQQAQKAGPVERPKFNADEQAHAVVPGFGHVRFWGDSAEGFAAALPSAQGPWLSLSAGGDDGAFGAGYLAGWSASGPRPDFAVVTGVSTGALMAPYVFLGERFNDDLRKSYTDTTAADVFEVGATPESMLDDWPLKKTIEKRVTPELLQAIAAEHRKGRRLFVVTTNLDAGRPVVWDMGAIAVQGGEAGLALFRSVLLSSSSIPGIFQPVHIDVQVDGRRVEEMHADGSIIAPFYIAPESVLTGDADVALPAREIYLVINSKLKPDFNLVVRDKLSIVGRFISIALKGGMRMQLTQARQGADKLGLALNLIAIPEMLSLTTQKSFDSDYMSKLYAFGERQGRAVAITCLSSACRRTHQAWRQTVPE